MCRLSRRQWGGANPIITRSDERLIHRLSVAMIFVSMYDQLGRGQCRRVDFGRAAAARVSSRAELPLARTPIKSVLLSTLTSLMSSLTLRGARHGVVLLRSQQHLATAPMVGGPV